MASVASISFSLALFLTITFSLIFTITATTQTIKKESRLHFFVHERIKSPNATAVKVVSGPSDQFNPIYNFGDIFVLDDLITEGPDPKSRPLGRLQGLQSISSLNGYDGLVALNLVFNKLNSWKGSSLTILGRNPTKEAVIELPVVGGTGQFRFAEGYTLLRVISSNVISGYSTFKMEVTVLHI